MKKKYISITVNFKMLKAVICHMQSLFKRGNRNIYRQIYKLYQACPGCRQGNRYLHFNSQAFTGGCLLVPDSLFLTKLQASACNFVKKKTLAQMFF